MPPGNPANEVGIQQATQAFLDARRLAIEAPQRVIETREQLVRAITGQEEMQGLEKAGWLLACNSRLLESDITESADAIIGILKTVDTLLQETGMPVMTYSGRTTTTPAIYNFFVSSGQGLQVEVVDDKPAFSLGASRVAKPAQKDSVSTKVLLRAVTEPYEVEAIDVRRQIFASDKPIRSQNTSDLMVVGADAIIAFVDRLLTLSHSDFQVRQARKAVFEIWKMAKDAGVRLDSKSHGIAAWLKAEQNSVVHDAAKRTVEDLIRGKKIDSIVLNGLGEDLSISPEAVAQAAHQYILRLSRDIGRKVMSLRGQYEPTSISE